MVTFSVTDPSGELWPTLERGLQSDRNGRLVLAEFGRDTDRGGVLLQQWLSTEPGAAIINQVTGGTVERLINIAKAEAVHIYQQRLPLPIPQQLPADLADFTNREENIERIGAMLASDRPATVAISGPGGVGKTSLAIHVAHRVRAAYPDGQLYIDMQGHLGPVVDPADIVSGFLRDFGFDGAVIPESAADRERMYRSVLAERKVLILVDNAAAAGHVRPLLPGGPGCSVLVTSRPPLAGLDAAAFVRLESLPAASALALLTGIVGTQRCGRERDAAQRIVTLCGQLPLAVRLAGARLAASESTPLARMADALHDESRRLQELRVGDREIRATLRLSYDRRPRPAQRLFRYLGLLEPGSFPAWVGASLLDIPLAEAETALADLVEHQLLSAHLIEGNTAPRYRFHDLTRVFARELLEAEPARAKGKASARLCDDFCLLAESYAVRLAPGGYFEPPAGDAGPGGRRPDRLAGAFDADPYEWFTTEYDTLLWAIERSAATGRKRTTWRLALALQDVFELRGGLHDWQRTAELGLQAARRDRHHLAVALAGRSLGIIHLYQGSFGAAIAELRPALAAARRYGTAKTTAITLRSLGESLSENGDRDEAFACFAEAMTIFDRLGEPEWAAWTRWSTGVAENVHGDPQGAIESLHDCLARFESLGQPRGVAVTLKSLAEIHIQLGRSADAISAVRQALPLFRATNDRLGEAIGMHRLADLLAEEGDVAAADELRANSRQFLRQVGNMEGFR